MTEESKAVAVISKMTEAQTQRAIEWVKTKCTNLTKGSGCPACGNKNWNISTEFVQVRAFYATDLAGGTTYPQMALVCTNCKLTFLFNALNTGILRNDELPDNLTPEDKGGPNV